MPFCPKKGQKWAKVGEAVGNNQLFCILLNIGTLVPIFLIFCMTLETIKGYKLTLNPFLRKILVLQIFDIFGHFWLKIDFHVYCSILAHYIFFRFFLFFLFFSVFYLYSFFYIFAFSFFYCFFILFSVSKVPWGPLFFMLVSIWIDDKYSTLAL